MTELFMTQFTLSLLVYALFFKWYAVPWLNKFSHYSILVILLIPHTMRHLGLSFIIPTIVDPEMPSSFANAAAYGDLIAGILAIIAVAALYKKWSFAIPLVWLFNIAGTLDLANALRQTEVIPYFNTAWYIPTFLVPLLLITHFLVFVQLIKNKPTPA